MTTVIGNASIAYVNELLAGMSKVVNGDISTIGTTLTISMPEINVQVVAKSTSSSSCSVTYYPITGSISLIDIRRCTVWGGSGIETFTVDGGTLTSSGTVVDDTVYTLSNDTSIHFIRVNSIIYIVTVWISGGGSRASLIYRKLL